MRRKQTQTRFNPYRYEANEREGYANGQHDVDGQHRLDRDRVEPRVFLQQGFRLDLLVLIDVLLRATVDRFVRLDHRHLGRDQ